jgi:EAL domain-containing protein (putative c-di-GMP-specific phosphodiesterase class I)
MNVIAEGVDTAEKLAQLTALGCQMAQGFHIALPMELDECAAWMRGRIEQVALHG